MCPEGYYAERETHTGSYSYIVGHRCNSGKLMLTSDKSTFGIQDELTIDVLRPKFKKLLRIVLVWYYNYMERGNIYGVVKVPTEVVGGL